MSGRSRPSGLRASGRLRIVAGSRRSRYIQVPQGEVRPTSEMVREALFNALGPIAGLSVLDLFAGSGALGLEALSRGAADCVFVEADLSVAVVVKQNIETLDFVQATRVVVADYQKALETLMKSGKVFDLLFVDPPYRMLSDVEVPLTRAIPALLAERGVVVIESDKSSEVLLGLTPVFARTYGDTKITMVTRTRSHA
jgi:16S rRNA (guanine966-N2)-methyltransferase